MAFLLCPFMNNTFILHHIIYFTKPYQSGNRIRIRIIKLLQNVPDILLRLFYVRASIHPQRLCIHMNQPVPRQRIGHQPAVLNVQQLPVIILLQHVLLFQCLIQLSQAPFRLFTFFQPSGIRDILMSANDANRIRAARLSLSATADIHLTGYGMYKAIDDLRRFLRKLSRILLKELQIFFVDMCPMV